MLNKRIKLYTFFVVCLLGFTSILTYDYHFKRAQSRLYDSLDIVDYLINQPIKYGIPIEKYFRVENDTENRKVFQIFWSNLLNDYPKEAITYKLEYRTSQKEGWMIATSRVEYVPRSIAPSQYPLTRCITIKEKSSIEFKLTLINENPKGDDVESTFRTSVAIENYVLASLDF